MKSIRRYFGFAFAAGILACGAAFGQPAGNEADRAFAEIEASLVGLQARSPRPPSSPAASPRQMREETWTAHDAKCRLLASRGADFLGAFPHDPRRWQVILWLAQNPPLFIRSFGNIPEDASPGAAFDAIVRDEAAEKEWSAKLGKFLRQLDTAADLSDAQLRAGVEVGYQWALRELRSQQRRGGPIDLKDLRERLARKMEHSVSAEATVKAAQEYFASVERMAGVEAARAEYDHFANSENQQVREIAAAKVGRLDFMNRSVELKFTSLDGREVDLAALRGKLVVLDFWATWCGPCLKDMPKVKKVYEAFHDRGLEIIGISCDFAPSPGDSPMMARQARTGPEVLEFTRKENMPWPQYYAGKRHTGGGNPLAAKFGVTGIPAMFLLDRTGRVVAANFWGDQLEAKVKERME